MDSFSTADTKRMTKMTEDDKLSEAEKKQLEHADAVIDGNRVDGNEKAYNRMEAKDRKTQIIEAGLELAVQDGLKNVRRQELAEFVGIARSLITHHFGDMNSLLEEIVRAAIDQGKLKVIGEAILLGYRTTLNLTTDIKKAAINALAEG